MSKLTVVQDHRRAAHDAAMAGILGAITDEISPVEREKRQLMQDKMALERAKIANEMGYQQALSGQSAGGMPPVNSGQAMDAGAAAGMAQATGQAGGRLPEADPSMKAATQVFGSPELLERAQAVDAMMSDLRKQADTIRAVDLRHPDPSARGAAQNRLAALTEKIGELQKQQAAIGKEVVANVASALQTLGPDGFRAQVSAIVGAPVLGFGTSKNGRLAMVVQDKGDGAPPSVYEVGQLPGSFLDDVIKQHTRTESATTIDPKTGRMVTTRATVMPNGDKTVVQEGVQHQADLQSAFGASLEHTRAQTAASRASAANSVAHAGLAGLQLQQQRALQAAALAQAKGLGLSPEQQAAMTMAGGGRGSVGKEAINPAAVREFLSRQSVDKLTGKVVTLPPSQEDVIAYYRWRNQQGITDDSVGLPRYLAEMSGTAPKPPVDQSVKNSGIPIFTRKEDVLMAIKRGELRSGDRFIGGDGRQYYAP